MKKHLLLSVLLGLLMLASINSCKTDDPDFHNNDPEMNDPNWIKLILTDKQRGVTAIYGNYEDTLLVATLNDMYITTDKGANWKQVYKGSTGISGISSYKGELIAFSAFGKNATHPFLFSRDNGLTWSHEGKSDALEYDDLKTSLSEIAIDNNVSYLIEYRYDGINVQKDPITDLPLPDQIYRIHGNEKTPFDLPSDRRINCITLDKKGRLNVGTEGTRFEYTIKGNTKTYPTQTDTAILYISRRPVK